MPAFDADQIDKVARDLGAAAVDPQLWPLLMEQLCRATGTTGAVLLQSDVRTPDVPRTAGVQELMSTYFAEGWHVRDARARGVPLWDAGQPVVMDQDIIDFNESSALFFYNELLHRFNFRWFAGVGFRAEESLWVLCLQRSPKEGPFDPEDKRILAPLSTQLTQVATLSKAVGRSVISGIADALAMVGKPALLLDRFGIVIGHNALADDLFDDELGVRGRRLVIADPKGAAVLARLIDLLRTTPDEPEFPTLTFVIHRQQQSALLVRVVPVPPAARAPFLGARALLTLIALDAPKTLLDEGLIAQTYHLTRAETRLASLIGAGLTPAQAAARLHISEATVRNQLKAIFSKTETHRQSELLLILSKFSV